MSRVLAVAVHPDDETLGCGGALLRHKAEGDEVHWLIATAIKEVDGFEAQAVKERREEIETVANIYGFSGVHELELSTCKTDTYDTLFLSHAFRDIFRQIKPEIVYLPFKNDAHSDHRIIFEAAFSCTKSFRFPFIKKILMVETLSETEFAPNFREDWFVPNVFVDITPYMEIKLKIIQCYKSELGEHPFPRNMKNIEALAILRGAMSGCTFAESFMLIKEKI